MIKTFDLERIEDEVGLCKLQGSIANEYIGQVILDVIHNECIYNRYYKRYGDLATDFYIKEEMQFNMLNNLLHYDPSNVSLNAVGWLTRLARLGANKGIQKFYVLKNGFGDSLEVDENRLDPVEDFELYKLENDIKL